MIKSFQTLPSSPHVYVLAPPPLFNDGFVGMDQSIINEVLPVMLEEIASESGPNVTFVDVVFRAFGGAKMTCHDCMYSCFGSGDGCHPSDFGHEQIAFALCSATDSLCTCPAMEPPGPPWSPHCLSSDRRVILILTIVPAYCCLMYLWIRRQRALETCDSGGRFPLGCGDYPLVIQAPTGAVAYCGAGSGGREYTWAREGTGESDSQQQLVGPRWSRSRGSTWSREGTGDFDVPEQLVGRDHHGQREFTWSREGTADYDLPLKFGGVGQLRP